MLRKYMVLYAPDANTGGDSSVSPDAKGQDSSPVAEDVKETTAEADEETAATVDDVEDSSTEDTGGDNAEDLNDSQTADSAVAVEDPNVVLDKPEDSKLDFHKHPRFQELIAERKRASEALEQSKPLIEQAKVLNEFMRDNQVPPQELQNALTYLSLLRRDPKAAYEMLRPTYEQLATYAGDRLPPDLQAEVAAGTISEERARQLAAATAAQQYSQWRQQQQGVVQQQSVGDVIATTTSSWAGQKQQTDPDLKPGSPLSEKVDLRLRAISAHKPAKSAADAMNNCEEAYTSAKKFMQSVQPRVVMTKKALQSRNVSSGNNQIIRTAEDVMKAIQRGVKPHEMRYS